MHIAFVDFIYHYNAGRPDLDEPLGGTTSAICFLARELVKIGVSCTFFNKVTSSETAHGITSFPLNALGDELEGQKYDAYIFCGRWTAELVNLVRAHTKGPLIGWMHESQFVDPLTPALDAFDGMVFVSEWQQRVNKLSAKSHWQQVVIHNAMNPKVANSFPENTSILSEKKTPPVLLFAGSFARGAFHIPPLLDQIRRYTDDFEMEMYCNLDPSRDLEKDASYIGWIKSLPNITHVGMVGQSELVEKMKKASILLAPNPWPETSCIAVIEGLASGLTAVTTNRAALPETASGFAHMTSVEEADHQTRFDMAVNYEAMAATTVKTLKEIKENPSVHEKGLRCQIDYFLANYQWSQRVEPWIAFISGLKEK